MNLLHEAIAISCIFQLVNVNWRCMLINMLLLMLRVEYMPGGSLYDYLHRNHNTLKLSQLLRFAIDVCKGMEYLHQNNIIHRDLKTANLLMDVDKVLVCECNFFVVLCIISALTIWHENRVSNDVFSFHMNSFGTVLQGHNWWPEWITFLWSSPRVQLQSTF